MADRSSPLWVGGRWVAWDEPVSSWTIAEHRLERGVNGIIDLALVVLGVAGAALAVWLYVQTGTDVAPWAFVRQERGHLYLFVFAASLLGDLYLTYRAASRQERHQPVLKKLLNEPSAPAAPSRPLQAGRAMTDEARRGLEDAFRLARRYRTAQLTPLFLFTALLSYHRVRELRARLALDEERLGQLVQAQLVQAADGGRGEPAVGDELRSVVLAAYKLAYDRRNPSLDVLDLFAACALNDETVRAILDELEVTPQTVLNVVAWIGIQERLRSQWRYQRSRSKYKPKNAMNRAMTAIATPLLDSMSTDYTALARAGVLGPCVARDQEFDEIFRVLESGGNPLLVGSPGIGKGALVEGIAQRMTTEDVPDALKDMRLVGLSVAALVGSGDAERRLTAVLHEVVRSGNIVLVLENVQNLVGVSSAGGATFDLSEIVGAALSSKRFRAIATTNPVDYRRYIETSPAIAGNFSEVAIEEVDTDRAIQILEAHAGSVEYRQHVFFSYAAVEKLVTLSQRYIHDRSLPEKALGLMDEVAAYAHDRRGKMAMVTAEDVAAVISEHTHVAVTRVTEQESAKLLHLEDVLHTRIVGQDEAVNAVASALRRARAELRDPKRPIATLLFLGPTGVGKTELAKTVAAAFFGSEEAMVRLDMSEYQDGQSIYRILGAPVSSDRGVAGGFLTDAVRRNPYTIVLLDELEKAHPDILNVFLQVMDDGRLTDSTGRTVDFTNVILIATSNAATSYIQERLAAGAEMSQLKTELVEHELQRSFRPEFLNRFDQIVVFRPLSQSDVVAITKLLLAKVAKRLEEKGIAFEASEAAVRELAAAGFDPLFGARPLRRVVQERVDDALAKFLLSGKIGRRDRAVLEPGGTIRVEQAPSILKTRV